MEDYHHAYFLRHHLIGAGLHEVAQKIRPLTLEQAKDDYENLKKQKPGSNLMGRIGNRATDYFFFEKRLDTGSKRGNNESFPQFLKRHGWNDATSYKRLYKMGIDEGRNSEQAAYSVFSLYWGAISSFKPIVARAVYDKFKPHTILDFSAGWGGRALAAMSLDINYIGFDTNTDLKKPYAEMIKAFPHDSKVEIHFQDSSKVDYSKYKYDMVFTSPPYYIKTKPTEAYKNMPHYKDRDEFNDKFLFPVVRNTYNNLQSGGTYALNVPMDMYDDLLPVLGKASSKILLPKVKRAGSGEGGYKEYIYFWKKGAKKLEGGAYKRKTLNNIKNRFKVAKNAQYNIADRVRQAISTLEKIINSNPDESLGDADNYNEAIALMTDINDDTLDKEQVIQSIEQLIQDIEEETDQVYPEEPEEEQPPHVPFQAPHKAFGAGKRGEFLPAPTGKSEYVVVKKSPTHGRGVFAKVDIKKGTRIADYKGDEMTMSEFKSKYGDDTRYTYSLGVMPRFKVGAQKKIISGKNKPYLTQNLSHYMNEKDTPNVEYKNRGVFAKKDLKAGEELFLRYPKNYPRSYDL